MAATDVPERHEARAAWPPAEAAGIGLAAASGGAGLAHEMLWTRRLVDLLGGTSEASSQVFGVFFIGLAIGAAAAVWIVPRVRRPWRAAAAAELAVVAGILPTVFLAPLTGWIWPWLGPDRLIGWQGSFAKGLVSAVVVLPPAIAMGLVLPLVAAAVGRSGIGSGRAANWLYAANTAGAATGLIVAVAVLIGRLGVMGSSLAVAAVNLAVAAGCLMVDRLSGRGGEPQPATKDLFHSAHTACEQTGLLRPVPSTPLAWACSHPGIVALAFFSGAGVLAAEVVALQELLLWATISFHAPAAILGAVIIALAVAAAWVPRLVHCVHDPAGLVPAGLAAAGLLMATTPPWFLTVAAWAGDPQASSPTAFALWITFVATLTLAPAILPAGLVFPLVVAGTTAAADRPGPSAAARLAVVLAANGLGGLVGAELANRFLLPRCGLHGSFGVIGLAYAAAAVAASGSRAAAGSLTLAGLAWPVAALTLTGWVTAIWLPQLPLVNPHIGFEVLSARAGPDGTVAVVRQIGLGRGILVANQYLLGSSGARWTEERQAHLPLLLHPAPRAVLFIGVATGITPGAALAHEQVEQVTAVEISPLVADAAAGFFAEENHGLLTDPRARVVIEDGRTLVAASRGEFDVIVGDLFLPWGSGAGRLYSVEHFRSVRRALAPGGLFCQWLPMYQLSAEQFSLIVATFQKVFPEVHGFRSSLDPARPGLALVGVTDGGLDWDAVATRTADVRAEEAILDPAVRHAAGVALLWLGRLPAATGEAKVNTLDDVALEIDAASLRVTRGCVDRYLFGDRWLNLAGRWLRDDERFAGSAAEARLVRLGQEIAGWEAVRDRLPGEQARAAVELLRRQLPAELLADEAADPNRGPMAAMLMSGQGSDRRRSPPPTP